MMRTKMNVASITVYTNGNKHDAKRFIVNPKYMRTFNAFLDQVTMATKATCAVRRIYTPHGSRQVGAISNLEPGGAYVAVSTGNFKKIAYGQKIDRGQSMTETTTTKTSRKQNITSRLRLSREKQMKTQKNIYVHRNGYNERPIQIFFHERLLRSLDQVLDVIQNKITCNRAVARLYTVNGEIIEDVKDLQPEERYVAVEQGQRFRHCSYNSSSENENVLHQTNKLPYIKPPKPKHISKDNSEDKNLKFKRKIPLPVINPKKENGFDVVYGYAKKQPRNLINRNTEMHSYKGGPLEACREKPLGIVHAHEEEIDVVNHYGNQQQEEVLDGNVTKMTTRRRKEMDHSSRQRTMNKENVTLHSINYASRSETENKISINTNQRIAHLKRIVSKKHALIDDRIMHRNITKDQRFAWHENNIASTKHYAETREQNVFGMHGRVGRELTRGAVKPNEMALKVKGTRREHGEHERRKRIEDWVDHTVEVKQKEDEISKVAKQLVMTIINNARKILEIGNDSNDANEIRTSHKQHYNTSKQLTTEYSRVFGLKE